MENASYQEIPAKLANVHLQFAIIFKFLWKIDMKYIETFFYFRSNLLSKILLALSIKVCSQKDVGLQSIADHLRDVFYIMGPNDELSIYR